MNIELVHQVDAVDPGRFQTDVQPFSNFSIREAGRLMKAQDIQQSCKVVIITRLRTDGGVSVAALHEQVVFS